MTPDEIKSAITGWCNQGASLQLVEDRSEPGADFVLGLRAGGHGSGGTVPVDVRLDQGGDRVTVTSTSTSSASPEAVRSLLDSRPAAIRGDTSADGTVITAHVYTDGFSKHTLIATVDEVAKTRTLVDELAGSAADTAATDGDLSQPVGTTSTTGESRPEPWAAASQQAQPQPASSFGTPTSALPAPSFGSPSPDAGGYSPLSGQPAQQSHPAGSAFAPTHTVPPQGMQAWAAPDPNGAVVATLGGGLPIQITEVRGAWAHVLCSNGWTGWVDGRIIGVAR
jgi:hypothetical protein